MSEIHESLKAIYAKMDEDEKALKDSGDIEGLYVFYFAKEWLKMNVKNREEFLLRFEALKKIVESEEFQGVIKICRTTLRKTYSVEEAEKAADQIIKLSESDVYLENKSLAHYRLLDKYKLPETYKTDSFRVHANIMERMCKYLDGLREL